jgi:sulfur carrier protein ThiS
MIVQVISMIPWREDLTKEISIKETTNIVSFIESMNLKWDMDALVVVNNVIVTDDYQVQDGDLIHLLLPILGG